MNHNLKKPCANCPFRTDIKPFLKMERAQDIVDSIVGMQQSFPCHKTVDYSEHSEGVETSKSEMCAGAMIMLEKINEPTQMMRISERLGMYDFTRLDMSAPVFDTPEDFVEAQEW